MKCYVLKSKNNINKLFAKVKISESDIEKRSLKKFIHNKSISLLTEMLNSFLTKPVIDETGITKNINIDFPFDIYNYDVKKWKEFLSKNGLEMIEADRKLEVGIITDRYR